MASRLKEDEKNERIIRGLLKQPANRKCINCNMLGPQYVCTTFLTFICTTCSGIHREFTHRVKSVSMAKFTSQEIAGLQAGGNERAREIYFKDWDPQRNLPDSNNVDRLRDFIKQVYVYKRYSGERSIDKPSQEANENRRSDAHHNGSQSPPYDDTYQRQYSDRGSPGHDVRRSPGYEQDNRRYSDFGRSPGRSGLVNDWRREDRFSNGRKSEGHRSSDGESKSGVRSPDSQKGSDLSSPPMVRPIRDVLGDNVVPIRISEPPKSNSSPTIGQRTASSSSLASSNGNPAEVKKETSLIDFDADPEPPVTATGTQVQPSNASQSVGQSTSTQSEDNWACFDDIQENNLSQAPPSSNSLESLLTQSSAPVSGSTSHVAAPITPSNGLFPSSAAGNLLFASVVNVSETPNVVPTLPASGQMASSFPNSASNQVITNGPVTEAIPNPVAQTTEVKSTGRNELPADLFTATYYPVPYQATGWHAGVAPGMGYPMHYNSAMSMPAFPQPSKSANPFDVKAEASPTPATVFPSMSSLNAALPNMEAPRGPMVSAMPSWTPPQPSSYPSAMPQLAQSFGSGMPGIYTGQQLPSNMATSRPQGLGAFGSEPTPFGSLNTAAATPNPSIGGNPFD